MFYVIIVIVSDSSKKIDKKAGILARNEYKGLEFGPEKRPNVAVDRVVLARARAHTHTHTCCQCRKEMKMTIERAF